jgi:hypothetical protein
MKNETLKAPRHDESFYYGCEQSTEKNRKGVRSSNFGDLLARTTRTLELFLLKKIRKARDDLSVFARPERPSGSLLREARRLSTGNSGVQYWEAERSLNGQTPATATQSCKVRLC